ncbi:MAG: thiolase domain-containing protein [Rhodococcus sp. (in: high G+C Gram-positive bacteria)]
MREVAVVGYAHAPHERSTSGTTNGVEMLVPVFEELYEQLSITKSDIDFWCSGSSDYLAGRAFSFISAIDSIGAVPPVNESHVEMDAAWALYEAWVKICTGQADTALVYGFGKSSAGPLPSILALQTDPYVVAPLWPDSISLAGLQARLGIESGHWDSRAMAEVVADSRRRAAARPGAQLAGDDERGGSLSTDPDVLLAQPFLSDPLRVHDCAPITDGAAAIVLAAGDRARELASSPAWITGIEHRIDSAEIGGRDLVTSASTRDSARAASRGDLAFDLAELHGPFSHQQLILQASIRLGSSTVINPSGGPLSGNPMFSAGLDRIGYAARPILDGSAGRTLAHATSGPLLQQNLVAVMEARA